MKIITSVLTIEDKVCLKNLEDANADEGLIETGLKKNKTKQKLRIKRASDHMLSGMGHAQAEASPGGLGES